VCLSSPFGAVKGHRFFSTAFFLLET